MKKFSPAAGTALAGIFAAVVAMGASSAARAADAVEQIPEAPIAVETAATAFTWSGPYIGLHGGYGWGNGEFSAGGADASENFDGGRFGGFVGYNWQMSNGFVAGLEGDVNYDWNEESVGGVDVSSGFSGSARARLGYAMDRALPYIAGGWTATNVKAEGPGIDTDDTLHGWTIGAGVDYAFTDNVFGRAEYRYNDFGSGNLAGTNVDFDQHVINVGIGVKF